MLFFLFCFYVFPYFVYLSADQRAHIKGWLSTQSQPSVAALASYIQTQFGVVFRSSQSYYDLLAQAGYSWKKTQARQPKADPQQGLDKREDLLNDSELLYEKSME